MRLEREKSWYLGNTAMKDNREHWSQHLATECKKLKSGGWEEKPEHTHYDVQFAVVTTAM